MGQVLYLMQQKKPLEKILAAVALATLAVGLMAGCSSQQTTTERDHSNREQFLNNAKARLDKLDQEVKDLKDKSVQSGNQASEEMEGQIANLEDQLSNVRDQLDHAQNDVADATQDAWDKTKSSVNSAVDKVEDTYKDVADRVS